MHWTIKLPKYACVMPLFTFPLKMCQIHGSVLAYILNQEEEDFITGLMNIKHCK